MTPCCIQPGHEPIPLTHTAAVSIFLRDPAIVPVGSFISLWVLPFRGLELLQGQLFPWHYIEQVREAVEACPLFVISLHHIPGSLLSVSRGEHCVPCSRVMVHAAMRFEIHLVQVLS